ncbi:MAG: hypothetical protein Fur005_35910 [Roseiflexaceae bacterium]
MLVGTIRGFVGAGAPRGVAVARGVAVGRADTRIGFGSPWLALLGAKGALHVRSINSAAASRICLGAIG